MTDKELAVEIVNRLNALMEPLDDTPEAKQLAEDVRKDIGRLIDARISCSEATHKHPKIQCVLDLENNKVLMGALGLITAITGVIPDGPRKGWGWIAAEYDDDDPDKFLRFCITRGIE